MFDDLVAKGWVKKTRTPDGLNTYKYSKKAFWANLWKQEPRLLDARGIVLDDEGKIVQLPFKKIHNLFENNTLVDRDRKVVAVRKINGFLGVASFWKDDLLVSTTGSTTSDFAVLARKHLNKPAITEILKANSDKSFMFEIVDETDLHICPEKPGAYLIGARNKYLGSPLHSENFLDFVAQGMNQNEDPVVVMRPEWFIDTFDNVRQKLKLVKHEGFLIRDAESGEPLCKIKSPHYLSKKAIMRLGQGKVELMWKKPEDFKQRLDEEFYEVYSHILATYTADQWKLLKDTDRRVVIEDFFNRA